MGNYALGFELKLHLGVLVQTYQKSKGITTGNVAEILEAEYGIMGAFFKKHGQQTADDMATNLADFIGGVNNPHAQGANLFNGAMAKTETRFKHFLSSKEAERVGIFGTPTQAALRGVNHRLSHPYRKSNPRRPSFIDSGLYQASFKSWVTGW